MQACENVTALLSAHGKTPPPSLQPKVDALQTQVQQAEALIFSGREEEAQKALLAMASEVEATGWEPLKSDFAFAGAQLAADRRDGPIVRERVHAAAKAALLSENPERAVRAWTLLGHFEADDHGPAEAELWIDYARAELPRVGDNPQLRGEVELASYAMYLHSDRYEEALRSLLAAKAQFERVYGVDHPRLALIWDEIGWTQSWMGDQDAAIVSSRKAVAMLEEKLGTEHPKLAKSLNHLAAIEEERDELDAALDHHLRALALREKLYGREHAEVSASLNNVAIVFARLGRGEEAVAHAERAVAIERKLGGGSGRLSSSLDTLGQAQLVQKLYAQAAASFQEGITLQDRSGHVVDSERALFLSGRGRAELGLGQTKRAIESLEAALKLFPATALSTYVGSARAALAEAYLRAGDSRALSMANSARADFAKAGKKGETMRQELDAAFAAGAAE